MELFERPYVLHFSTATIDGRIASSTAYSLLSCKFDKMRLLALRGWVNAVMVGARTVTIDDPGLVKRLGETKPYYRVVVDGRLTSPVNARVYRDGVVKTIVFTSGEAPREKVEVLKSMGVDVWVVGDQGVVDLREALRILLECYNVKRILVEGGGVLAYSLYKARLVDEFRITYAPVVFAAGRSVVDDPKGVGFRDWVESPRFKLVHVELCKCGNCVHHVYKVLDSTCCPVTGNPPYNLDALLASKSPVKPLTLCS